jgi:MFS family permease
VSGQVNRCISCPTDSRTVRLGCLVCLISLTGRYSWPEQCWSGKGFVSIAYTMGTLLAPLLGGVVYARAGYYAVFYMTFAIITVDIFLRLLLIEKKIAARWDPEAEPQIMVRKTKKQRHQLSQAVRMRPSRKEKVRQTHSRISSVAQKNRFPPIIMLLKSRRMLTALWVTFVICSLLTAVDAVLPLYCNRIFGWNSPVVDLSFWLLLYRTSRDYILPRSVTSLGLGSPL